MSQTLKGTILFTAIELVTLVVWGVILRLGAGLPFRTQVVAVVVLAAGLFVEHAISVQVGRGEPILDIFRNDAED
jgi:hypothetical protein